MNTLIVIACCLFAGVLGKEDIDKKYISDIYIPAQSFSGEWYLLYWGQPRKNQYYPKEVQCARAWGTSIDEAHVKIEQSVIFENGTQANYVKDLTIISLIGGKYLYKINFDGKEMMFKPTDFDKFNYFVGHSFYDHEKEYLFIFGRDPAVLDRYKKNLNKWNKGTKNQRNPAYKIKEKKCLGVFDEKK